MYKGYALFIKHRAFMDVCIEVDHHNEEGELVGRFWNMGQTRPYELGARIKLKIKDEKDWLVSINPERNGEWSPYNGKAF